MPHARKLDRDLQTFLAGLTWPPNVPAPAADLERDDDRVARLRFVDLELAVTERAVAREPGANAFDMINAIATLAEEWTRLHGGDPGVWPTGIRAQIMTTLDMRTAARWLLSFELAALLVDQAPPR